MSYRWISNYFLISIWLKATIELYVKPIKANVKIKNTISKDTKKKNPNNNLNIAYEPNFNKIPAKITDPGVGASTWASGNHIWTGKTGIFTAKPPNINNQKIIWRFVKKYDCKKNSKDDDPLLQ